MARPSPRSLEPVLFAAILVFAGILRFAGIGAVPLNEYEATHALTAFQVANGISTDLGDQPGYVTLTSALFWVLGASETVARLLPAVFGITLVALPWFWRDLLSERTALVLAFLLAIDPGMVALSHLAAGHMLAIVGALLTLTAWRFRRPVLAGFFAAIAIAASPTVWYGIGAAALTWLVLRPKLQKTKPEGLRAAALAFVATLAVGVTLSFTQIQGLAAPALTLSAFIFGVDSIPSVGIGDVLFALLGYGFPVVIFGVLGALSAWRQRNSMGRALTFIAVFGLAIILINPNRQVANLAWVLLPLAALSAGYLAPYLRAPDEEPPAAYGEALLMLLLMVFMAFSLVRAAGEGYVAYFEPGSILPRFSPSGVVAIAVGGLGVLVTVLVGLGWSTRSATKGLVWATALAFAFVSISAATRFTRVDPTAANELWSSGPASGTLSLMEETVRDLSFWDQGQLAAVPIDIRTESAALRWELRDYSIDTSETPRLAITAADETASTEFAAYRGQSFALSQVRNWQGWPGNFFGWLFFRQPSTQPQTIILWASAELFPGDGLGLQPATEGSTP